MAGSSKELPVFLLWAQRPRNELGKPKKVGNIPPTALSKLVNLSGQDSGNRTVDLEAIATGS